jgi:DNA-binding transcriptional LysR family regulator
MQEFDQIKIRRLDGTLLLVFQGLMRHRKAVLVAEDLGLTPSTVSHALGRLRDLFGDELFLRRADGLDPTAAAHRLAPDIAAALGHLGMALAPEPTFAPATAEATVRLAAFDLEIAVLLPALLARLGAAAPGLRLAVRTSDRDLALRQLADGTIDLALGYFWAVPAHAVAVPLLSEGYVTAARAGHPFLAAPTLAAFCGAAHLVVAPGGGTAGSRDGIVDRVLARLGLAREVRVSVPQFMTALAMLGQTDLIATLPERIVTLHGARFGLGWCATPVEVRRFEASALRHRRNERSALLNWLVGELAAVARAV